METKIVKSEEALYDAYLTETEEIRAEILRLESERKTLNDEFKKEKEIMLTEGGEKSHKLQEKIVELEEQIESINKNYKIQKREVFDSIYLSKKANKELKEKQEKDFKGKKLVARIAAVVGVPLTAGISASVKYVNDVEDATYNAAMEYLAEHPSEHYVPIDVIQHASDGIFPYAPVIYYTTLAAVTTLAFGKYFVTRHKIRKNEKMQKEFDEKIKDLEAKREVETGVVKNEITELQKNKQEVILLESAEAIPRIEKEYSESCASIDLKIEVLNLRKDICYNNYLMKMSMKGAGYANAESVGRVIKLGKPERYSGKIDEMKRNLTAIETKITTQNTRNEDMTA